MLIFALAFFVVTVLCCLGEVIYERDWPRDTFRFFLMACALLIMVASS